MAESELDLSNEETLFQLVDILIPPEQAHVPCLNSMIFREPFLFSNIVPSTNSIVGLVLLILNWFLQSS